MTCCPRSCVSLHLSRRSWEPNWNSPLVSFVSANDQLPDTGYRDEVRDQIPSVLAIRRTSVIEWPVAFTPLVNRSCRLR